MEVDLSSRGYPSKVHSLQFDDAFQLSHDGDRFLVAIGEVTGMVAIFDTEDRRVVRMKRVELGRGMEHAEGID